MTTLQLVKEEGGSIPSLPIIGFTEAERGDIEALAGLLMRAIDQSGYGKYREALQGGITAAVAEVQEMPASAATWQHLAAVEVERGEEASLRVWEAVKQAARAELVSGHRAGAVMEGSQSSPMERARFIILRASLADQWQPANGIEWNLIDTMTQAATAQTYWMEKLTMRTQEEAAEDKRDRQKLSQQEQWFRYGQWLPARITTSEAMQEAMGMTDRWNRIYLRTLRQLRDLRRYNVVIHAPGQVNIGEKQVNVNRGEASQRRRAKKRLLK